MLISEHIATFVNTAKQKIAAYTTDIDKLKDKGSDYIDLTASQRYNRLELYMFLELISPTENITDGDHFCNWTDNEILEEIQYLEHKNDLKSFPALTFNTANPKIIDNSVNSGTTPSDGVSWPTGTYGQILEYNAVGTPVAVDFNEYGGMRTDDIDTYFQGRT